MPDPARVVGSGARIYLLEQSPLGKGARRSRGGEWPRLRGTAARGRERPAMDGRAGSPAERCRIAMEGYGCDSPCFAFAKDLLEQSPLGKGARRSRGGEWPRLRGIAARGRERPAMDGRAGSSGERCRIAMEGIVRTPGPRFASQTLGFMGFAHEWRWPRRLTSAPASIDTVAAFRPWRGFRSSVARGRRGHHRRASTTLA
jgi:hypothetical protein